MSYDFQEALLSCTKVCGKCLNFVFHWQLKKILCFPRAETYFIVKNGRFYPNSSTTLRNNKQSTSVSNEKVQTIRKSCVILLQGIFVMPTRDFVVNLTPRNNSVCKSLSNLGISHIFMNFNS